MVLGLDACRSVFFFGMIPWSDGSLMFRFWDDDNIFLDLGHLHGMPIHRFE